MDGAPSLFPPFERRAERWRKCVRVPCESCGVCFYQQLLDGEISPGSAIEFEQVMTRQFLAFETQLFVDTHGGAEKS